MNGEMNWTLEADIKSYFDKIPPKLLMEMLSERVADTSFLRLVGKCLHVGVLDGEQYSEPQVGTAQGSVLSPLLGNIYLHKVLDEWFAKEVVGRMGGKARLIRFADDFITGFELREDAERVMRALEQRMAKFGLTLHSDKTRIGPGTFNFLGFTVYWRRARNGSWTLAMKTRAVRLKRAMQSVRDFCRRHRHESVKEQHAGLCRRLNGHYNYFGINGNTRALQELAKEARSAWRKWLGRRGQRRVVTWAWFEALLAAMPLPRPIIRVRIWGTTG
jgi:group II intron reverse transcriptase/maturase